MAFTTSPSPTYRDRSRSLPSEWPLHFLVMRQWDFSLYVNTHTLLHSLAITSKLKLSLVSFMSILTCMWCVASAICRMRKMCTFGRHWANFLIFLSCLFWSWNLWVGTVEPEAERRSVRGPRKKSSRWRGTSRGPQSIALFLQTSRGKRKQHRQHG